MAVAAAEARIVGVHVGIGAAAGKAGAESEHAANRRLRTLEAAAVDVGEACIVGIDAYVLARAAGEGKMWRVESGSNGEGGKCRAANLPAPPERRRRNRASRPVCCHKQWSLLLHACSNVQSRRAHSPACLRRGNRCIAVAIIVPRISTPRRSRRGQRARPRRAWPSRSSPSDLIHSPRPQVCSDETYTFLKPPLRTHRGPIQRRAFVSDHLSNTFAHPCIKIGVHPGTFSVRAGRQVALGQHTTPPGLAEGASAPPLPLRL